MDLYQDGRMGLLTGTNPGEICYYRRKPNGTYASAETLRQKKGARLALGQSLTVAAADWDQDGDMDLLVGNTAGNVYLVPNEGSPRKPAFGEPKMLKANGKIIRADNGNSAPYAADWDGDGKLDLLLGSETGRVVWFQNTGDNANPVLGAPVTLVEPYDRVQRAEPTGIGYRTKVCVADWNGDGMKDLIVGDCQSLKDRTLHGYVWVLLRKTEPVEVSKAR